MTSIYRLPRHWKGLNKAQDYKSELFKTLNKLLELQVDSNGEYVGNEKIKAIKEETLPKKWTELGGFLGLTRYCRHFIKHFAQISAATNAATPGNKKLKCSEEMNMSFEIIK